MSNSSTPKAQPKEKSRKTYGKFTRQKMKHPSGSVYWRVSGTVNGKRYRKNFQDKKEATEEKHRLETKQLASRIHEKLVVTSMSREQCEEAKLAFKRLEDRSGIRENDDDERSDDLRQTARKRATSSSKKYGFTRYSSAPAYKPSIFSSCKPRAVMIITGVRSPSLRTLLKTPKPSSSRIIILNTNTSYSTRRIRSRAKAPDCVISV